MNTSKIPGVAEGLSEGDKYGIGFGVGIGLFVLLGCGACLVFYCRRPRPSEPVVVLAERRGSATPRAERRASSVERQATTVVRQAATVERRGSKAALQLRSTSPSSSV